MFQLSPDSRYRLPRGAGRALLALKLAHGLAPHEDLLRRESAEPESRRSVLYVVPDTLQFDEAIEDLQFFLHHVAVDSDHPALLPFPNWDVLPFDVVSPSPEVSARRLATLWQLLRRDWAIVVVPISALLQRLVAPRLLVPCCFEVRVGMRADRDLLVAALARTGYRRSTLVEEPGQFVARGAVVDFFPPNASTPMRIECKNQTVSAIRAFHASDQRSFAEQERLDVVPASEFILPLVRPVHEALQRGERVVAQEIEEVIAKLHQRVRELDVPLSSFRPIEEAFTLGLAWPGIEHLQPFVDSSGATLFEYLDPNSRVLLADETELAVACDQAEAVVAERAAKMTAESHLIPSIEESYLESHAVASWVSERNPYAVNTVEIVSADELGRDRTLLQSRSGEQPADVRDLQIYSNSSIDDILQRAVGQEHPYQVFAQELRQQLDSGIRLAVIVGHEPRRARVAELLQSYGIASEFGVKLEPGRTAVQILLGTLSAGIYSKRDKLRLILDREIFPELPNRRRNPAVRNIRRFLGELSQLKENDFVVHADHGVGLYRGLRTVTVEGLTAELLELEYAESAKLLLPIDQIGKVQKYVGAEGVKPALSKLGGKTWSKAKQKVYQNVAELAGQLLSLYAQREVAEGFSFGEQDEEDARFSETFLFEPTADQAKAIVDVFEDMAKETPMDRLICGDVGYGKTEVALRAAYKAVQRGKQVAVLVPTTVLADQHYATFQERFSGFPVSVGCVSRFFSADENRATIEKVRTGRLDIVIGTHRLLQKDVVFHDLGLVVIDEEHRFGVAQKEKLKALRTSVDMLTLTATPIPRTLHMSLLGIRDLSVLETPPCDRQVIRTYLAPYDGRLVREAVMRELSRSGQVFYVYNRVENIGAIAEELRTLVPEARILVGHGQMKESVLEDVMHRFVKHEADVLVCTTIVESGVDIPNANTMIIRNADRFGLAQLYQLRGRVGRSSRRAYAYLMIPDPRTLGVEARKRLEVLQALDDLGQGFRLALQDMEIRGAGNLLGRDQSGQINQVGFELYSRILREAIRKLRSREEEERGVAALPPFEPEVQLGLPTFIPSLFVPDVGDRLLLYQRFVELRDEQEARELLEEIEDRFGQPPQEVFVLQQVMLVRALLKRMGIVRAQWRQRALMLTFHPDLRMRGDKILAVVQRSEGRYRLTPTMMLIVEMSEEKPEPEQFVQVVRQVQRDLGELFAG